MDVKNLITFCILLGSIIFCGLYFGLIEAVMAIIIAVFAGLPLLM